MDYYIKFHETNQIYKTEQTCIQMETGNTFLLPRLNLNNFKLTKKGCKCATAVMSYETSRQDSYQKLDLTQNIQNIHYFCSLLPRNVKISLILNSNMNIIIHQLLNLKDKFGIYNLIKQFFVYIEVRNQVKYGGHLDFFSSRCFRRLLNT